MTPAPSSADSKGMTAAPAHTAPMLRRMRNYWIATAGPATHRAAPRCC